MGRFKRAWAALTSKPQSGPRASTRSYSGAKLDRADRWWGSRSGPVSEVARDLEMLRARSRDRAQNDPHGSKLVNALVDSIVLTGIRPTVDTDVEKANKIYDLWQQWGKRPAVGSGLDIYGIQRLMCRTWIVSGEAFAQLVTVSNGKIPLKIKLFEPEHVPLNTIERPDLASGIEFNPAGEKIAYHILDHHPGDTLQAPGKLIRVPADQIIHCFTPDRPGQIRGVPVMAPVLMALWDLEGYMEAIRVATRAAATLVMTVEGGDSPEPPAFLPDGLALDGAEDGLRLVTDSYGSPIERLGPGMIAYLPDGKTVKYTNPQPPGNIKEFLAASHREIAAGVGLSYHVLTGDMSDASFAQAKLGLIEQDKHIRAMRESVFVPLVLDPLWAAFIRACVVSGQLPPGDYPVRWSAPRSQSADRLTEVKASLLEMRAGLRSRSEIIESEGRDPDEVNRDIALDAQKRKDLGIVSDGDPSQVSLSGALQAVMEAE